MENWAITNQERTKFFTLYGYKPAFTDNINLAYVFKSEAEALQYEESINAWLDLESDVAPYVLEISDLLAEKQLIEYCHFNTTYMMDSIRECSPDRRLVVCFNSAGCIEVWRTNKERTFTGAILEFKPNKNINYIGFKNLLSSFSVL